MAHFRPSTSNPALSRSNSSTPQPHPSLPARPPPTSAGTHQTKSSFPDPTSSNGYGVYGGSHTPAFKPRAVATARATPDGSWHGTYSQQPSMTGSTGYYAQQYPSYQYPQSANQNSQYGTVGAAQVTNGPQIQNPFPLPSQGQSLNYGQAAAPYDAEEQAQIAQWQTAYMGNNTYESSNQNVSEPAKPAKPAQPSGYAKSAPGVATGATSVTGPASRANPPHDDEGSSVAKDPEEANTTVVRSGGGQSWEDPSLLEWDPSHFRLFVGNLAGEVTDDSLAKAFSKYSSLSKAKVLRDKRTTKSRGYGFVSFADGDEYFQAFKEMQNKYIGSHPVQLKKAVSNVKPTFKSAKGKDGHGGKTGKEERKNATAPTPGQGITKKQPKTKGGYKFLG